MTDNDGKKYDNPQHAFFMWNNIATNKPENTNIMNQLRLIGRQKHVVKQKLQVLQDARNYCFNAIATFTKKITCIYSTQTDT